MRRTVVLFLVSCLAVHTLSSSAVPKDTGAGGWISLFDGKSFDGWTFDVLDGSKPETIWSVESGTIMGRGKGKSTSVIRTLKDYADYELELEWRWPDKPGNILCLFPNCHLLFDAWAFAIEDDGTLIGALEGKLNEIESHEINRDYLAYHRRLYRTANS